ncbi:MAG: hypothetical protein ACTSO9_04290, partial [Candidatus Helarchaeota archaeon]
MSLNFVKIKDLKGDSKKVNIEVKIIKKTSEREVYNKKKGKYQRVGEFLIGDETGSFVLTVWDSEIEKIESLVGKSI